MSNQDHVENARSAINTLRDFSYRSENANELARISLGLIDVVSHLMAEDNIAEKVADKIDAVGLINKAKFIASHE